MSNEQLIIPNKIKVGFQNREDTYTKKLAFVVYYFKNTLKKEKSWTSWCDPKIKPMDFDNKPTEGFVINKNGGGKRGYDWYGRNAFVRIYDPRDFEFEISVENLLFILQESDASKGKGLSGQFVYAWNGQHLILLPTSSQEYKKSLEFTNLQKISVKSKELIPGATYLTKKEKEVIYLGRFDNYDIEEKVNNKIRTKSHSKNYTFVKADWKTSKSRSYYGYNINSNSYHISPNLSGISKLVSDTVASNYADLIDKYNSEFKYNIKKMIGFELKDNESGCYHKDKLDKLKDLDVYFHLHRYSNNTFAVSKIYYIEDNILKCMKYINYNIDSNGYIYDGYKSYYSNHNCVGKLNNKINNTSGKLYIKFEDESEIDVDEFYSVKYNNY